MLLFEANDLLMELMLLVDIDVPETTDVTKKLDEFTTVLIKGGNEVREQLIGLGAYAIVCKAWLSCCSSGVMDVPSPAPGADECRNSVLQTLYALTPGYPEVIDGTGWQIISQTIDKTVPEKTQILMLKLLRNVCRASEENRETFTWNLGLLEPLVQLIAIEKPSAELLREWCAAVKCVLLSDDPKVPYNRAPERKRVIARSRILPVLVGHLHHQEYLEDEGTLNAVVILLGTMAVNDNYCVQIESGNVIPGILAILKGHFHNKTLVRNTISLLRYLCSNLSFREHCSSYSLIKWVLELIHYYKNESDVVYVGMSCCAFMCIKNACQTSQLLAKNGLSTIIHVMNDYRQEITILKSALLCVRNVCENSGMETRDKLVELGYHPFLFQLMEDYPDLKEFHIMPVLKELGMSEINQIEEPGLVQEPEVEPSTITETQEE